MHTAVGPNATQSSGGEAHPSPSHAPGAGAQLDSLERSATHGLPSTYALGDAKHPPQQLE